MFCTKERKTGNLTTYHFVALSCLLICTIFWDFLHGLKMGNMLGDPSILFIYLNALEFRSSWLDSTLSIANNLAILSKALSKIIELIQILFVL